jgi:hypothetical protein
MPSEASADDIIERHLNDAVSLIETGYRYLVLAELNSKGMRLRWCSRADWSLFSASLLLEAAEIGAKCAKRSGWRPLINSLTGSAHKLFLRNRECRRKIN